MHYLYIIHSKTANKFYVGETADLKNRIDQHNDHFFKGSYTKIASDWELKIALEFETIKQAKSAETFVKKMNSRVFLEKLLEDSQWLVDRFKK